MSVFRFSAARLLLLVAALLVTAGSATVASASRSSEQAQRLAKAEPGGLLAPTRIGKVALGASVFTVARWLGRPDRTWVAPEGGYGQNGPVIFSGELWGYSCGSYRIGKSLVPCWTLFGFVNGKLGSFSTASGAFHTAKGTRVGTPLRSVTAKEHGAWSGWQVQCPGIVLATSASLVFVAHVDSRSRAVYSLYLSRQGPAGSFSSCGS